MDENDRAVDDAVKRLIRTPEPSAADKQHALARLSQRIKQEKIRRAPGSWRLVPLAAGALALLIVAVLIVDSLRMTPVMAAFEEIAEAVEQVDPQQLTDTEFFYLTSEEIALGVVPAEVLTGGDFAKPELVYQLNSEREVWYGNRGAVQIRTTNTGVNFFSPEDRDAYFDAGLDESLDRLGEPTTITVTEEQRPNWPATPAELGAAIAQAAQGDRSETVENVDVALDILRDPRNPPAVRAATLRLIGDLDEVVLIDSDSPGFSFGLHYFEQGVRRQMKFTITSEGTLTRESISLVDSDPTLGLPEGAILRRAHYGDLEVVNELPGPGT